MKKTLLISELRVTQKDLRNPDCLKPWAAKVKDKYFFTPERSKIKVACFPDDQMYIRDGHHRCCAILLAGRKYLRWDEFEFEFWGNYEMWTEACPEQGWITPFDPRTEVRLGNFFDFKNRFMNLQEGKAHFIKQNREMYCEPRNGIHTVADLLASELRRLK